jgi:hypothetical protein
MSINHDMAPFLLLLSDSYTQKMHSKRRWHCYPRGQKLMSHLNHAVLLVSNNKPEEHASIFRSTLRTDTVCFSDTLATFKTAKCHNPEVTCCGHLKSVWAIKSIFHINLFP